MINKPGPLYLISDFARYSSRMVSYHILCTKEVKLYPTNIDVGIFLHKFCQLAYHVWFCNIVAIHPDYNVAITISNTKIKYCRKLKRYILNNETRNWNFMRRFFPDNPINNSS